jgi:hypothetical protein
MAGDVSTAFPDASPIAKKLSSAIPLPCGRSPASTKNSPIQGPHHQVETANSPQCKIYTYLCRINGMLCKTCMKNTKSDHRAKKHVK